MKNPDRKWFVLSFLNKNHNKLKADYIFDQAILRLDLCSKTHDEVASEYGITTRTLHRWIKNAGIIIPRGRIDPFHLRIIYQTFGIPSRLGGSGKA